MEFEEKLTAMGFDWKITPSENGFRVELIDTMNNYKSVISKVSGIPNLKGAQEILGLMAHKHRLTYESKA
jgi:hypothetical protein